MTITDEMVERAWAAIVGAGVSGICFQASIIRADLRTALEAVAVPAQAAQEPAVPDLEGWQKVGDGTPLDAWLETKLYTEEGFSESFCRLMSLGDDPEWVSRDGRTTVTHHSYAAPSHWRWPKLPSTEPAQTPRNLPFHDETVDGLNSLTIRPSSLPSTHQSAPQCFSSLPSGGSDPSVTLDCGGADTVRPQSGDGK